MPFKSKAQQGWMFSHKPEMAKEFADATPDIKALPDTLHTEAKKKALYELVHKK